MKKKKEPKELSQAEREYIVLNRYSLDLDTSDRDAINKIVGALYERRKTI